MENRGSKAMALAALIVGVVGLTIGFAAFSATLTINSSATVTPNETAVFDDLFGFAADPTNGTVEKVYADAWSGITVNFDGTNQTRTVTHNIVNGSEYVAYGQNLPTELTIKECGKADGSQATDVLVEAACDEITATVTAPASVAAKTDAGDSTGLVTIVINGPRTAVDGDIAVEFNELALNYSTAQ